MTPRAVMLTGLLAAAVAMAGCAASARSARPAPSPVASSTGPGDWWITVSPCALLSSAQLRGLGLTSPGQLLLGDGPGRANVCNWRTGGRFLAITLSASPYTELFAHTGHVSPVSFPGGRRGELDVDSDGTGGCQLTIEAAGGSSALVFMAGRPVKGPSMCPPAQKVASLIRTEIPRP